MESSGASQLHGEESEDMSCGVKIQGKQKQDARHTLGGRDDISHLSSEGVGGIQRHRDRAIGDDCCKVVVAVKVAVCVRNGSHHNLHTRRKTTQAVAFVGAFVCYKLAQATTLTPLH